MQVKTRQYKGHGAFERDANKLGKDGWSVKSVTDQPQRSGFMRILLTGGLALIWKPPSRILVTYERE